MQVKNASDKNGIKYITFGVGVYIGNDAGGSKAIDAADVFAKATKRDYLHGPCTVTFGQRNYAVGKYALHMHNST